MSCSPEGNYALRVYSSSPDHGVKLSVIQTTDRQKADFGFCYGWAAKNRSTIKKHPGTHEIKAVLFDVAQPLGFIPFEHAEMYIQFV